MHLSKLFILVSLLVTGCSSSKDIIYAVGGGALAVIEWDNNKGTLTEIQKVKIGISSGALGYHPDYQLLYTATGRSLVEGSRNGRIFSIENDGKIKLKKEISFPHGYSQFTIDQSGQFLLTSSYSEGHVDVFKLDTEGIPELVQTVFENKTKAHAIQINDENYVYVPYVKENNAIHQYSLNPATGKLKALKPATAKVDPTAGPRHLTFHPSKKIVYFSNEQAVGVSVYSINDDGTLKFLQICPANNFKAAKGRSASSVTVTPDGKYVYSALRSKDPNVNSIQHYQVLEDGTLKPAGYTKCDSIPWIIKLTSDGSHLLVSATAGKTLTAFEIQKNGSLVKKSSIPCPEGFRDLKIIKR